MNGIEFRWISLPDTIFQQHVIKNIYGTKVALQYRDRLNPMESGLQPAIWSEWQYVPFARF